MYKKKHKTRNIIILFSVIVFGLLLSGIFLCYNFNFPSYFLKDGFLFINNKITYPFRDDKDLESLKKQIEELTAYKEKNEELMIEVNKLKEALKIDTLLTDSTYINASVVGRNLDYWNEKLIINKGSNDGVVNKMAVINNGSLIGITDDVSSFNSSVMLLSNNKFPINISVKIIVDDNAFYGILNNYDSDSNMFEVMGVVENVTLPSGSRVVTTGFGNIFPSGLLIGYVDSVTTDNFDLAKVVKVKAGINYDDISYVTVAKRDL